MPGVGTLPDWGREIRTSHGQEELVFELSVDHLRATAGVALIVFEAVWLLSSPCSPRDIKSVF